MQDFKIRKRIPNIITGLIFGILAMKLWPSFYSYVFYVVSVLLFVYTDQIIKKFFLSAGCGKYKLKGNAAKLIVKDKNGNIIRKK